jgi:hypothetical protein
VNDVPPSQEPDDVDDFYRRASALDPSRPSEWVRRTVLARAADLAASHAATHVKAVRPAGTRAWWRPAVVGTLAAAALAGLLIAPHLITPDAPPRTALQPVHVPRPEAAATMAARAPVPGQAPDMRTNQVPSSLPSSEAERGGEPSRALHGPRPAARDVAAAGEGRRVSRNNSTATALTTTALPSAAPMAPAARLTDPAAALRRAAEIGDLPALRALLDEKSDIDARDANGRTALMLATLHGQSVIVDALLASGADPNAADAHGTTPLQAAVAGDQPAIVAALRKAGAR